MVETTSIKTTTGNITKNVIVENHKLQQDKWFEDAREKFKNIDKEDIFDKTKKYLDSQNKSFYIKKEELQKQFTRYLNKNKDFIYKSEKLKLKKEVVARFASRMSTEANEEIVNFV